MIDAAVAAIRAGQPVIVPTDTVYGLATSPYHEEGVRTLYRLKGRDDAQPTAIVAPDLDTLFECVPELRGPAGRIARTLLPGPYTLVLANPARRFGWLCGPRPEAIGVRVPQLNGPAADLLARVGAVAATSANLSGGPDPRRLDDVPEQLRAAAAAEVDGGELPGVPSTVLDVTGPEPIVVREGAVSAAEALQRLAAVETTG
jgi:tRNA threonylcarbamoyl adenosine modification protein (Sua5/YciO/YrdC/YwlC family)